MEVEVEDEGGGKNVAKYYQHFLGVVFQLSAADPHRHAPSTSCPVHAGAVVYTSVALHADAMV
eukprot:7067643-Pyramimonas_sp.AAC.1